MERDFEVVTLYCLCAVGKPLGPVRGTSLDHRPNGHANRPLPLPFNSYDFGRRFELPSMHRPLVPDKSQGHPSSSCRLAPLRH